ncbi:hypothetical protein GW17_00036981 [Ensete ventricosum]|nr:hypothetical protein GW17_00036981 [Ensete ventricosum]
MLPVHRGSQALLPLRLCLFFIFVIVVCYLMIGFPLNIVVEQICGNDNVLNHLSIPAAYFTHSEISMVGLIELEEFVLLMQLIYRPDTEEILGVHILGLHAADLIHEASIAIALGTHLQVIIFHT